MGKSDVGQSRPPTWLDELPELVRENAAFVRELVGALSDYREDSQASRDSWKEPRACDLESARHAVRRLRRELRLLPADLVGNAALHMNPSQTADEFANNLDTLEWEIDYRVPPGKRESHRPEDEARHQLENGVWAAARRAGFTSSIEVASVLVAAYKAAGIGLDLDSLRRAARRAVNRLSSGSEDPEDPGDVPDILKRTKPRRIS